MVDDTSAPKSKGGRRGQHPNARATQFKKGVSPNPGGKAKGYGEFTKAARERANPACLDKMESLMNDPKMPGAVQLAAAKELKEWGYGRSFNPVITGGLTAMDTFEPGGAGGTPLLKAAKDADRGREYELRRQQVDEA